MYQAALPGARFDKHEAFNTACLSLWRVWSNEKIQLPRCRDIRELFYRLSRHIPSLNAGARRLGPCLLSGNMQTCRQLVDPMSLWEQVMWKMSLFYSYS